MTTGTYHRRVTEPPGGLFTFEEYNRALETGGLYDSSFQPQGSRRRHPRREDVTQQNRTMERRDNRRGINARVNDHNGDYNDYDATNRSDAWDVIEDSSLPPPPPGTTWYHNGHHRAYPQHPPLQPVPVPVFVAPATASRHCKGGFVAEEIDRTSTMKG